MLFTVTWMELEMITLSEVSQTEKDKYHMISFIRVIFKMIQMNLFTKQKQLKDLENELMFIGGNCWGEGYIGSLGLTCTHTNIFKIDNQQGPTV